MVRDIPSWEGKTANLFYSVACTLLPYLPFRGGFSLAPREAASMRLKARGLALHGGPRLAGWRRVAQQGVIFYVMDGPRHLP